MAQQQRFVLDGIPVSACEGAFVRRFEMDPKDAEAVSYDDTVVLVVVARVGAPAFRTDKNGELIRVNKFEISVGRVAPLDMGHELAEMFDLDIQQKLPFGAPLPALAAPAPPARPASAPQTAGTAPVDSFLPRGTPVASAAPGAGSHANDEALREFLA